MQKNLEKLGLKLETEKQTFNFQRDKKYSSTKKTTNSCCVVIFRIVKCKMQKITNETKNIITKNDFIVQVFKVSNRSSWIGGNYKNVCNQVG